MFDVTANSLAFEVTTRKFGSQYLGISPKGASDQLSFETASILLGEPREFKCVEIIYSAHITFTHKVLFTLTGAHFKEMTLIQNSNRVQLEHATVYAADAGDLLHLKEAVLGFRIYLFATPFNDKNSNKIGLTRGPYSQWFSPLPKKIRLIKGVEYHLMKEPSQLLESRWKISPSSSLMGIKLDGEEIEASRFDIISSAVTDGTMQLTSKGPIILMRHRQTTGGYPRVYQVAAADIDHLAQSPTGSLVQFEEISLEKAKELLIKREDELEHFKNSYR